jgi:hypothetical protein
MFVSILAPLAENNLRAGFFLKSNSFGRIKSL